MSDLVIFSIYHKEFALPECEFIQPLRVAPIFLQYPDMPAHDDVSDHIADKNTTFSELTALYRIWKKLDELPTRWVGLCHYRRYFSLPEETVKKKMFSSRTVVDPRDVYFKPFTEHDFAQVCSEDMHEALVKELELGKVIVPAEATLMLESGQRLSMKDHYIYCHVPEDWTLMRNAVLKFQPELELEFDTFFSQKTSMHCYNMFVAGKDFVSAYCSWLFPILFELENTVKLSEYPYQRRVFGFFSERLFNFYLHLHRVPKSPFPVVFFS